MPADNVLIRKATSEDRYFLRKMFYEAVFVPEGEAAPPFEIVDEPALQKYTQDWMLPTDLGLVAEMKGGPVGMLWARLFKAEDPGYGFVDENTPELSLAIKQERQGQGIGKALMAAGMQAIQHQGYAQVSLSVSKENHRAIKMYRSMGFITHSENKEDYVMVKQLNP